MPWLSKVDRGCALGMLESGPKQTDVAQRSGVHRTTIARLWVCFNTRGSFDDRPRPGQRRATTTLQDRYIRRTHTRERFQFATITARTDKCALIGLVITYVGFNGPTFYSRMSRDLC